jgi:AmiR/NasT family two-component response regulator
MERHIETVLRASQSLKLLEKTSQQLEEELAERKLTQTAKSILIETCGMSEEEAHLHLRSLSRKSRRPLKAIAQDLIDAGAHRP